MVSTELFVVVLVNDISYYVGQAVFLGRIRLFTVLVAI